MNYLAVLITCPNRKEANKIAAVLIDKKLAACVNLIPEVKSIFHWQGKVDQAEEVLLLVKSRRSLFSKITSLVLKNHSYDTPEIIALPIVKGHKKYLDWIKDSTS